MTYLLTTHQKLPEVKHAVKLTIDLPGNGVKNLLVYAVDKRLVFETLLLDPVAEKYLHFNHGAVFEGEIKALVAIPGNGGKEVARYAILLDKRITVLEPPLNDVDEFSIDLVPLLGHLSILEIDPILLSCSDFNYTYLVLYKNTGFVTVFNLDALLQIKEDGVMLHKRSQNIGPCSKTFSIGNVVVCLIAVSNASPIILAVLYRDIDFNFSLRYYAIKPDLHTLQVVRQMELFAGAPSLVMSTGDGFLVAGDLKLWFFPMLNNTVCLAELAGDPVFPVSYNNPHNVVTLDLCVNKMSYLGSRFQASTQIDKNRHLIISDTGTTLLVYLDVSCFASTTTVNQFQVVDLGKSTIPSSLVHLEDNVFFAGSHRSRSVLFRILPRAPHIDILMCFANSSPIMNIQIQEKNNKKAILLSRGDFHGGELELVLDSPCKIEKFHLALVSIEASSVTIVKSAGSDMAILRDDTSKVTDVLAYPSLTKTTMSYDFQGGDLNRQERVRMLEIPQGKHITNWQIDSQRTIEYSTEGPTQITLKSQNDVSVFVDQMDQVSSLDWFDNGTSLDVYAVLWNGTLAHLLFTERDAKVIGTISTALQGKISLLRFPLDKTQYCLVLLDGEGLVFHTLVSKDDNDTSPIWNLQESHYLKASHISGTFHMSVGLNGGILIHDSFSIFQLSQDKKFHTCLALTKLHTFNYRVRDCKLVEHTESSGVFVVLFEDGNLSQYLFKDRQGHHDSFTSKGLIALSVNVSDQHTVVLQLESAPNLSTGQIDTVPSLVLLDQLTLQLLHVYKPHEMSNYVDMCVMDGKYTLDGQAYIVVANSVEDPFEILKVFRVLLNKIIPVPGIYPNGILPKTFAFSKIACHKHMVCLVGDMSLTFQLTHGNGQAQWLGGILLHASLPFFVADVAGNDDFWVLADAFRGAFAVPRYALLSTPVLAPFEETFGTAVVALKTVPMFVYGDAEGNIWGAKKSGDATINAQTGQFNSLSFADVFHINIGEEQINDIAVLLENPITILVATVKGNVYRLQDLSQYKHADNYMLKTYKGPDGLTAAQNEVFGSSYNIADARSFVQPKDAEKLLAEPLKIELAKMCSDMSVCSYEKT